jgi:hypothetical protein
MAGGSGGSKQHNGTKFKGCPPRESVQGQDTSSSLMVRHLSGWLNIVKDRSTPKYVQSVSRMFYPEAYNHCHRELNDRKPAVITATTVGGWLGQCCTEEVAPG